MSTSSPLFPSMEKPTDNTLPKAPEILIQIRGGSVQEIVSDSPAFITIADWDNKDIETQFIDNGPVIFNEAMADVKHEMFVGKEDDPE